MHEGDSGWSRAQESEVMEGCAGEVTGDILERVGGKEEVGCRIGDVKRLVQSTSSMIQGRI